MHTGNDNLILGAAIGYLNNQITAFLVSLKQTQFNGKIVLYVRGDPSSFDSHGLRVDFIQVPYLDSALQSLPPTAQRFFIFRHYLSHNPVKGRIFITDVRDVIFQQDPFAFPALAHFDFFYALEDRIIARCPMNSKWLATRYGYGVLQKLRGEIISCCGTLIGSHRGIESYLAKVCAHMSGAPAFYGIDTAVHNYIIRQDPIENQCALLNGLGPIMTMHYMELDALRYTQDGFLLNYDNTIPNIVHQYDRLSELDKRRLSSLRTTSI